MKILFKVLAVFFGLGFLGQLIAGNLFPIGLIFATLFGYLGWKKEGKSEDSINEQANISN